MAIITDINQPKNPNRISRMIYIIAPLLILAALCIGALVFIDRLFLADMFGAGDGDRKPVDD